MRYATLLLGIAIMLALVATSAMAAPIDKKCIRETREMFGVGLAQAKRICTPVGPNEYGWVCENPETGKIVRLKGEGTRRKQDAVCE